MRIDKDENIETRGKELLYAEDVLGKLCCLFLATALLMVSGQILIYLLVAAPAQGEKVSTSQSIGAISGVVSS